MRGHEGDEGGSEGGADRELEVTRSTLAVYEFRFGAPPPELVAILEAADASELTRWLAKVSRSTADELAAEIRKSGAAKPKRRSAR